MAARKTEPQPFPTRGTPSGYREIWDGDDSTVIEAQIAERERQSVAAYEAAATVKRRQGRDAGQAAMRRLSSPAEDIATDPQQ
jgi:hypothetical protein